jgi:hypothetical protein
LTPIAPLASRLVPILVILVAIGFPRFFLPPGDLRLPAPFLGPSLFLAQLLSLPFQLFALALESFPLRKSFPFFLAQPAAPALPIVPLETRIRVSVSVVWVVIPATAIVVGIIVWIGSPPAIIGLVIPNRGASGENQETDGNEQPKDQSFDIHMRSPFFQIS